MKYSKLLTISALIISVFAQCTNKNAKTFVLLKTSKGDIKIELFDDTPLHKENFIKLVKSGFYDEVLFHRVIQDFMIQTGDPDSKTAKSGEPLGSGGPGYTIDAEIKRNHFHQKGAVAAARISDSQNPDRKSSGSQFYIVLGKVQDANELTADVDLLTYYFKRYVTEQKLDSLKNYILSLQRGRNQAELKRLIFSYKEEIEAFYKISCNKQYPMERVPVYTTKGGTPHLDEQYSIFGQVVEGMNIVESISTVETDANDRPKEDIKIIEAKVLK